MSGILLNTGTSTFNELISNGKTFKVPTYQRDYSWEHEYWEDLWLDILELPSEEFHYMGYIVTQEDPLHKKTFYRLFAVFSG